MKKTLFFTLFSLSFTMLSAQANTFVRIGCTNKAVVTIDSSIVVVDRLFLQGIPLEAPYCNELPSGYAYYHASVEIGTVKYVLQERVGNDWVNRTDAWVSQRSYQFNYNFIQGQTYRVQIRILPVLPKAWALSLGGTASPCLIIGNIHLNAGTPFIYYSQELEFVDSPVPSVTLLDVFGFPNNDVFCYGDPVYLNASSSFGETSYMINMSMHELNQGAEIGWTPCGTYTGQIGDYINVLDLWRSHHPDWDLWPGFSYRIHIVYQNSCNPWLNYFKWFDVVGFGCRTMNDKPAKITVYPNPAASEIRILGLESTVGYSIPYLVSDMTGRPLKEGYLASAALPIDVSGLVNGMYVVTLALENRTVAEKFTVTR